MNKCHLSGFLGKDPEWKNDGKTVLGFTVATQRRKKVGDNYEKVTDWHNVVAFGKTAENIKKFFKSGSPITVHGQYTVDVVEKDGQNKYYYNLNLNEFDFPPGKKDQDQGGAGSAGASSPTAMAPIGDDIPF